MEIVKLKTEKEISDLVNKSKNLIIIDCGAVWCGPCKVFGKFYKDFVSKYNESNNVTFCELDIDEFPEFCELNQITSVPTILFIKYSEIVDRIVGVDVEKFKSSLQKHTPVSKKNLD